MATSDLTLKYLQRTKMMATSDLTLKYLQRTKMNWKRLINDLVNDALYSSAHFFSCIFVTRRKTLMQVA